VAVWPEGRQATTADDRGAFRFDDLPRRPVCFVVAGESPVKTAGSCPDPRSPDRARMPGFRPVTSTLPAMSRTFWVETLGCPKNQVDSDKLTGTMLAGRARPGRRARGRRPGRGQHLRLHRGGPAESIDVILDLADRKAAGAELVVTGCMAERYGDELADALPRPTRSSASACRSRSARPGRRSVPAFDLLNLPGRRPPPPGPT
jgi:hypothetical protein